MFEFLSAHWSDLLAVVAGVLSVASIVVKLTPTTADDDFIAKVEEIVAKLGVKSDAAK